MPILLKTGFVKNGIPFLSLLSLKGILIRMFWRIPTKNCNIKKCLDDDIPVIVKNKLNIIADITNEI